MTQASKPQSSTPRRWTVSQTQASGQEGALCGPWAWLVPLPWHSLGASWDLLIDIWFMAWHRPEGTLEGSRHPPCWHWHFSAFSPCLHLPPEVLNLHLHRQLKRWHQKIKTWLPFSVENVFGGDFSLAFWGKATLNLYWNRNYEPGPVLRLFYWILQAHLWRRHQGWTDLQEKRGSKGSVVKSRAWGWMGFPPQSPALSVPLRNASLRHSPCVFFYLYWFLNWTYGRDIG